MSLLLAIFFYLGSLGILAALVSAGCWVVGAYAMRLKAKWRWAFGILCPGTIVTSVAFGLIYYAYIDALDIVAESLKYSGLFGGIAVVFAFAITAFLESRFGPNLS